MNKLNKFKQFLLLLLGLLASRVGDLRAETNLTDSFRCTAAPTSAAQAITIATKTQKKYAELTSLEAHFIQESYLAALDTREQSTGEVVYARPAKMLWTYSAPEAQTFLLRDSTVWFYQPRERQVMIDDFRKAVISDLPVAFLLGVGNLTTDFKVVEACPSGEQQLMLTLSPKKLASDGEGMADFKLLVDAVTFSPRGALVVDMGGNTTAIRFSLTHEGRAVGKDIFEPKFPAGTDLNDQRVALQRSMSESSTR